MANRRARTGRVVKDNRIFDVYIMMDGHYIGRSESLYYRRNIRDVGVYTGPVDVAVQLALAARS